MATGIRLDFLLAARAGTDLIETAAFTMDGISCRVRAQFRQFDRGWMVSVWLPSGLPVIQGQLANDGEDMFGNVVVTGMPPGRLVVVDTTGKHRDPDLDDWRAGVWLVYVPTGLL